MGEKMRKNVKKWVNKYYKNNYLFHQLFANDQVIIEQDEYDIDCMMRKLLNTKENGN